MMRQDDPRKCTAAKLVRLGLASRIHRPWFIPRHAIVLNPISEQILTSADKNERLTLVAVDCSWNKFAESFPRRLRGINRRLPTLLAANPVNYGKRSILSSLEALAAAAFILGESETAENILSIFKWGPTFLSLNESLLKQYASAKGEQEVEQITLQYFRTGQIP